MSKAEKLGFEYGESKGEWVFDGNTDQATYRMVLEGVQSGDPMVMDMCPSPLSGEWSGESIPELSDWFGIDLEDDEIASEFEDGFMQGFWSKVVEIAEEMTR